MRGQVAHNLRIFRQLLTREISSRFVGSATGWLWLFITPLMMLGVYSFVFGVIFRARIPEGFDVPFVAWLAVAMWPWLAFSEAVQRGSRAILANASLIGKVSMPRELPVLASSASVFLLQMVGYLAVLVVIQWLAADVHWLALPAAIWILLLMLVLGVGLALFFAALQVFLRDVEHFLPTFFLLWFFLTPIIYAPQMLPDELRGYLNLNPMTWIVTRLREVLLQGHWVPGLGDLAMLAGCLAVAAFGWFIFRRMSPHFEDFL